MYISFGFNLIEKLATDSRCQTWPVEFNFEEREGVAAIVLGLDVKVSLRRENRNSNILPLILLKSFYFIEVARVGFHNLSLPPRVIVGLKICIIYRSKIKKVAKFRNLMPVSRVIATPTIFSTQTRFQLL